MTEFKILIFGSFIVRPFAIILDSFQGKFQQKVDFSNKIAPLMCRFANTEGGNTNGEFFYCEIYHASDLCLCNV
jgi:hypothetical protein